MSKVKELKEKRGKIAADMTALIPKDGSGLTPENRVKFDAMDAEQKSIKADIDRYESADNLEAELRNQSVRPAGEKGKMDAEHRRKMYRKLYFDSILRSSMGSLARVGGATKSDPNARVRWMGERTKDVEAIERLVSEDNEMRQDPEWRDNQAGTQSISYTQGVAGGFFVPAGFVYDVEIATKFFAPLADGKVIRILETATGNVLPYPTNNDTSEAWTVIGEAAQVSDQGQTANYPTSGTTPSGQPGNLTMGVVNFGAWKGSTGLVRVSLELLQDSAFDLEDFLKNAFAVRLGRGYEYYLTRGTGVNQPTGILTAVTASGQAATIATGSSTNDGSANTGSNSIGTNDLIALEHSIDPTYRRGARFMLHDNTLKTIKQLLDKYGRPLWVPGISVNAPDTILGYEYVINQSMPQIAAAANTMLFGSLQKFIMRKVRDLSVLRLDERFADFGEVAFIAFSRIDSNLVDAGVHPIGYLQMHS